jgi:DNA-binding LytR/AlgR family response regulator
MNVLIVEDEIHTAKNLAKNIKLIEPQTNILQIIDSVEDAIDFFKQKNEIDLIFMDIQLSDGISFDIFKEIEIDIPLIFTTSFNEYAIKAFEVNSIDYLLKPIEPKNLEKSLEKFHKKTSKEKSNPNFEALLTLINQQNKEFKSRFLVKTPKGLQTIAIADLAYFYIENQIVFLKTKEAKRHIIDIKLEEIESSIDPKMFFRLSRQCIANIESIKEIHNYFNNTLKIELNPPLDQEIIVSRYRVKDFKEWLDR